MGTDTDDVSQAQGGQLGLFVRVMKHVFVQTNL